MSQNQNGIFETFFKPKLKPKICLLNCHLGAAPQAVEVPHPQVLRQHVKLLVGLELALVLFLLLDGDLFFCTFNVESVQGGPSGRIAGLGRL